MLLLTIEVPFGWCSRLSSGVDIVRRGFVLERLVPSERSRVIGLEIERDPVPPEPSLKVRDPLLVCIDLLLLALHLGR
jgi:hypothetical protein